MAFQVFLAVRVLQHDSSEGYGNATYVHEIDILHDWHSIFLRKQLISSLPGHRPVYQIQIYVIHIEVFERILQGWFYIIWVLLVAPELGRNE
jgi:hypothetical protein